MSEKPESENPSLATGDDLNEGFALVGKFLGYFALVEESLDGILNTVLHLDRDKSRILLAHIQFSAKCDIVRTWVDYLGDAFSSYDRERVKLTREAVAKLTTNRNTLAHVLFYPIQGGGVQLFRSKNAGEVRTSFVDNLGKREI